MKNSLMSWRRTATLSIAIALFGSSIASAQTPAGNTPASSIDRTALLGKAAFVPSAPAPAIRLAKAQGGPHRVRNGAIAGAGIGLGVGFVAQWGACEDQCLMGDDPWGGIAVFTGIGAAAGAAIGALMNHANREADARRSTTMAIAPLLSRTQKGLAFAMTWR